MPFAWTEDAVEAMKRLYKQGYSASQIAVQIGAPSRNAVIGKLHRAGMTEANTPERQRASRNAARRVRGKQSPKPSRTRKEFNPPAPRPPSRPRSQKPQLTKFTPDPNLTPEQSEERRKRLWELGQEKLAASHNVDLGNVPFEMLNEHHCRFAFGSHPPFKFCGKLRVEEYGPSGPRMSAYCEEHHQLCKSSRIGKPL